MSKQRNIKRDAKRTKSQEACGHASRYRNKRGCVVCRRENGATLGKPFKKRKTRTPAPESALSHELHKLDAMIGAMHK